MWEVWSLRKVGGHISEILQTKKGPLSTVISVVLVNVVNLCEKPDAKYALEIVLHEIPIEMTGFWHEICWATAALILHFS